jgi:hypothetical protein
MAAARGCGLAVNVGGGAPLCSAHFIHNRTPTPTRLQVVKDNELGALKEALDGQYTEPGPGGDPIRNPSVLPTGKNIHALDPQSIPTQVQPRRGGGLGPSFRATATASLPKRGLSRRWLGRMAPACNAPGPLTCTSPPLLPPPPKGRAQERAPHRRPPAGAREGQQRRQVSVPWRPARRARRRLGAGPCSRGHVCVRGSRRRGEDIKGPSPDPCSLRHAHLPQVARDHRSGAVGH